MCLFDQETFMGSCSALLSLPVGGTRHHLEFSVEMDSVKDSRLSAHFLTSILSAGPVAGVLISPFSREFAALKLAWGTRH